VAVCEVIEVVKDVSIDWVRRAVIVRLRGILLLDHSRIALEASLNSRRNVEEV
jgi:hypothetical protein